MNIPSRRYVFPYFLLFFILSISPLVVAQTTPDYAPVSPVPGAPYAPEETVLVKIGFRDHDTKGPIKGAEVIATADFLPLSVPLRDDGAHADDLADDGVYATTLKIPSDVTPGVHKIVIELKGTATYVGIRFENFIKINQTPITLTFLSPSSDQSFNVGKKVPIKVLIKYENTSLINAKVWCDPPILTEPSISLVEAEGGTGVYSTEYKIGDEDPIGFWVIRCACRPIQTELYGIPCSNSIQVEITQVVWKKFIYIPIIAIPAAAILIFYYLKIRAKHKVKERKKIDVSKGESALLIGSKTDRTGTLSEYVRGKRSLVFAFQPSTYKALENKEEIEELKKKKEEINSVIESTKKKYFERTISEEMLNEIVKENQKKLIEIDVSLAKRAVHIKTIQISDYSEIEDKLPAELEKERYDACIVDALDRIVTKEPVDKIKDFIAALNKTLKEKGMASIFVIDSKLATQKNVVEIKNLFEKEVTV